MIKHLLAAAAVALTLQLIAAPASALAIYNSRALFQSANPGLTLEDFETNVFTDIATCGTSLDSTTNDACFTPGQLQPGITYAAGGANMVGLDQNSGIPGVTSSVIGPNGFVDDLIITLTGAGLVTAIGLDILSGSGSGAITATVFGPGGGLGGQVLNLALGQPQFIGFDDPGGITQLVFSGGGVAIGELIDNVEFGNPQDVPAPGTALLLACGLMGLRFSARRITQR